MAITQVELDSFYEFASKKLNNSEAGLTLEDCLRDWHAARERSETIAGVQRGVADMQAGRAWSLEDVDQNIRAEFGFSRD